LCESTGVSAVAREIGFLNNSGEIQELKNYDDASNPTKPAKVDREKKSKKRSLPVDEEDSDDDSASSQGKKSKALKTNKGLRHFSKKVCEKVERKGKTTYNEVADELVTELTQGTEASAVDSKNIRRRVYDALNVLMAMDIIEKDKKDIQWKGLPQVVQQERNTLQSDFKEIEERLEKKKEQLAELESQRELYKKLILKNQARENFAAENSVPEMTEKLFLPFIIVQTKKETIINCEMSPDRDEYFFDFSLPFFHF